MSRRLSRAKWSRAWPRAELSREPSRAEWSRAKPSRAELRPKPSRAEPSRTKPSRNLNISMPSWVSGSSPPTPHNKVPKPNFPGQRT